MSAKLLYSLSDENPDLHKQIGCMNGIFQLFDRNHILGARRSTRNSRKGLPPGPNDKHEKESTSSSQKSSEKDTTKTAREKERISTESSRASFSSSCSSTFSSLDCKTTHLEPSYNRTKFPETPSREVPTKQSQSCNLRDVVKDSINREPRGLLVKTTKEEGVRKVIKHIDSPRPQSLNRRDSGLESLRVLTNLREATANYYAPRFSYDESRDTFRSTVKINELPRLSLDSRGPNSRLKSSSWGDLQKGYGNSTKSVNVEQEPGSAKGLSSSIVAKLMGLEALPNSTPANEDLDLFSRPSNQVSESPRNFKDLVSPRPRNPDSVVKKTSSLRFPMEAAPWRQQDGGKGNKKPAFKHREAAPTRAPSPLSVYGEIEKRLTELEFKKSSKDLRALKQILEAMQKSKGMLDNKNEDSPSKFSSQRSIGSPNYITNKGNSPPQRYESPIVIMKPAKFSEKARNPASPEALIGGISDLRKLRTQTPADDRKDLINKSRAKGPPSQPARSMNNKNTSVTTPPSAKASRMNQQMSRENIVGTGTVSPRLQQKKLGMEKQLRPTTASNTSSPRRQLNRQTSESSSPCRKFRSKSSNLWQSDDQLSDISSETKNLSQQSDTISLRSESNVSFASQTDTEVTSTSRMDEIRNPTARLRKDGSMAELATGSAPEQPSPVSVLDPAFYGDDSPSPVKKISNAFKDDESEWDQVMDYKKLENIEHLTQKLRRLNSTNNEDTIDYVVSLCNNTDSDHRYISEILLASGLLLRDLTTDLTTIQLDSSGHLINPDLFFVLEQTKESNGFSGNSHTHSSKKSRSKNNKRIKRKLIFDTVNEILAQKIASSKAQLRRERSLMGRKLLQDLCSEIDKFQGKNLVCRLDNEDDSQRDVICDDLKNESVSWVDFDGEIPGLVLDVERLIFKDLIDEIVSNAGVSLQALQQARLSNYRRQLFSK